MKAGRFGFGLRGAFPALAGTRTRLYSLCVVAHRRKRDESFSLPNCRTELPAKARSCFVKVQLNEGF
jgi:hypothetical protein